jgi:WD40 repeat protein
MVPRGPGSNYGLEHKPRLQPVNYLFDLELVLSAKNPVAGSTELHRDSDSPVSAVCFSPNGHWLVTGDVTGRVWLLDLRSQDPAVTPVVVGGHEGGVLAVGIGPDNHWLVTGGRDGVARLWDLKAQDPAVSPVVLRGHGGAVRAVDFSPDGRWLGTGSDNHTARLWPLQVNDLIELARVTVARNFFDDERQAHFPGELYHKTFAELPSPDDKPSE